METLQEVFLNFAKLGDLDVQEVLLRGYGDIMDFGGQSYAHSILSLPPSLRLESQQLMKYHDFEHINKTVFTYLLEKSRHLPPEAIVCKG